MPRYLVGNGRTGDCFEVEAASEQAACRYLGWAESDCVAVEVPRPGKTRSAQSEGRWWLRRKRVSDQSLLQRLPRRVH